MDAQFAHRIFIAPYYLGWKNLKEAVTGKQPKNDRVIQEIAQSVLEQQPLKIGSEERWLALLAGALLVIPGVNTLVTVAALDFEKTKNGTKYPF